MSPPAKRVVLCTNERCTYGVFKDEECDEHCRYCGAPCIEQCPNPECRVRILEVVGEYVASEESTCPRCGEQWRYDPYAPDVGTE
jgi:hypothetical protein